MTHFLVGVVLPQGTDIFDDAAVDAVLEQTLGPYSEHLTVPAYERPCECIGIKALAWASEQAHAQLGPFTQPERPDWMEAMFADREAFKALCADEDAYDAFRARCDAWREATVKPLEDEHDRRWTEMRDAALATREDAGKPDPECMDCHGSGTRTTTYSPRSKYDYYSVAGRWTTLIALHHLEHAYPDLFPKTRRREITSLSAEQFADAVTPKMQEYYRRFIGGSPEVARFAPAHTDPGQELPGGSDAFFQCVSTDLYAEWLERHGPEWAVYDLVLAPEQDLDRRWLSMGDHGWWGRFKPAATPEEWVQTSRAVLDEYAGHLLVFVDCHI